MTNSVSVQGDDSVFRNLHATRSGGTNPLGLLIALSLALLAGLLLLLPRPNAPRSLGKVASGLADSGAQDSGELLLYCAAGMRAPIEKIVEQYQQEYGIRIQLQYGGSNTLLSQIEVSQIGDLYLAGDESYIRLAQEKDLVKEALPLARMEAVIGVPRGNPKDIDRVEDLLREDVRTVLANPDQAAIGVATREAFIASGHWSALEARVRQHGVFKPTVGDVASDIVLGSVDAGVLWDSVAAQVAEIEIIRVPELANVGANITLGVLASCKNPTAALQFARYVTARDKGLEIMRQLHYQPVEGDLWQEVPQLTFFAGSVNRRALEPIIQVFAQREGIEINTVYNGCGILTAQMRSMTGSGSVNFPDTYMACDVYYLETVKELFQEAVRVSNTRIVIVVAEGNPKKIEQLADLIRPGIRVAVGQPDQCTIGVLSRQLLQSEGLYERLQQGGNIVTETATSALLVPSVTTGAADAALVYATDAQAEADRIDAVPIDSIKARAVQPFSIARSSDHKQLGRRLFQAIAHSRKQFEEAGFVWQLDQGESTAGATDAGE
jgi:molybdate transport system substrate-binding protein